MGKEEMLLMAFGAPLLMIGVALFVGLRELGRLRAEVGRLGTGMADIAESLKRLEGLPGSVERLVRAVAEHDAVRPPEGNDARQVFGEDMEWVANMWHAFNQTVD